MNTTNRSPYGANEENTGREDMKVKLSTLWMVVMLNMVYADIIGFLSPGFLNGVLAGYAEETQITEGLLLVAAGVLQIPIFMILLSRVLPHKPNRRANIIAGLITIAYVIGGGSATLHYIFFAAIEVVCMLLIVGYAWKWRSPVGKPSTAALNQGMVGGNS